MLHQYRTIYLVIMITVIVLFLSIVTHPAKLQQNFFSIPVESVGIESIEVTHYGIGGEEKKVLTSNEDIQEVYAYWTKVKIGSETNERCDDNTTIYKFLYKNGMIFTIEKECNNYIHEGKSYQIIEPKS